MNLWANDAALVQGAELTVRAWLRGLSALTELVCAHRVECEKSMVLRIFVCACRLWCAAEQEEIALNPTK